MVDFGAQSRKHLDEWQMHVKDKFARIYEAATFAGEDQEMHYDANWNDSLIFDKTGAVKDLYDQQ